MTDKTEKYKSEMLKAIKRHKIMRFEHAFGGFVTFSKTTAYLHKLNESDDIREALLKNRNKGVNSLLNKWIESDNATLQIAAMRMIAEEDDRKRLNQQYVDHSTKGEKINIPVIEWVK